MLIILMTLLWTPPTKGIITVKRLTEQKGYVDIYIRDHDIVKESDIILHIINLDDIENILDNITENIDLMKIKNKELLQLELLDARNKLLTLKPKYNRHRRGLINGIGGISKFLFGTMDDEDRQNIQKYLFSIDEIKTNNNQQILINDYFNVTLNHLKTVIKNDREKIEKELNTINKFLEVENERNIYLEQFTNIQLLKNKIEHIQDNIISAKHGIIHPSILTSNEIKKYEIDYNKLKYIQFGTTFLNNSYLIFGIKIPKTFITIRLRFIVPLPNNQSYEIDSNIEKTFEFENKMYKFEENKNLKDLKLSNHCLVKRNCELIKNKDLEIIQLDIDKIVIKNAFNISTIQTCNSEKIILNGNYLLNFNNCSIRIKDYYFSNILEHTKEIQLIESDKLLKNFTYKITLDEINMENQKNVKNIKELKMHTKLTYGYNILIVITIIIIITLICVKHKKIIIKLNNRIQENSNLKGGVVTYKNNTDKIDDFLNKISK